MGSYLPIVSLTTALMAILNPFFKLPPPLKGTGFPKPISVSYFLSAQKTSPHNVVFNQLFCE